MGPWATRLYVAGSTLQLMPDVVVVSNINAKSGDIFDIELDAEAHAASLANSRETSTTSSGRSALGLGDDVTFRARHFGVWWTLKSMITEFDWPHRFVDEQVRGPFAVMRHEHLFKAQPDGSTVMTDRMSFRAPLGLLGRTVEPVLSVYLRRLLRERADYVKARAEAP